MVKTSSIEMILAAIAFMAFFPAVAHQQASTLLDQGYNDMYNLDFQAAHNSFREWERQNPTDAMGPVSDAAAYLFSEFDRLHILQSQLFVNNDTYLDQTATVPDPAVRAEFQTDLNKASQLAESALRKSPTNKHALLAKVLLLGLDSDYKSLIERQNMAALAEIKSGTEIAQKLLAEHPDCYDAHLASGIQNYLLSLKPAPVRWFLRATGAQTDKEAGLANLKIVAERGHYLRPYADLLLAVAALRDHDKEKARQILAGLAAQFPGNSLYREELKKLS